MYFTRLLYHSGQSQAFCSDYPVWSMQGVISYTFIFQDQYLVVANCTSCGVRISNEAKPQAKTQIFCWNLSSGWCLARTALVAVWWRVCFISKTWDSLYVLSANWECLVMFACLLKPHVGMDTLSIELSGEKVEDVGPHIIAMLESPSEDAMSEPQRNGPLAFGS